MWKNSRVVRVEDTQAVFISLEFEGLKYPTKCNSVFVYWLFFFWQIVEIKWIERETQSTRTFIKRQKVLQCVIITRGENNLFPWFVRGHSNLDWAVIIYNSSKKLITGSVCSKHNITTFFLVLSHKYKSESSPSGGLNRSIMLASLWLCDLK